MCRTRKRRNIIYKKKEGRVRFFTLQHCVTATAMYGCNTRMTVYQNAYARYYMVCVRRMSRFCTQVVMQTVFGSWGFSHGRT